MTIERLRTKDATLKAQIDSAMASWKDEDGADVDPTQEQLDVVTALVDEREQVQASIKTMRRVEAVEASSAVPVAQGDGAVKSAPVVRALREIPERHAFTANLWGECHALKANANGASITAADALARMGYEASLQSGENDADGGALIPTQTGGFIDFLYPRSVFLRSGPNVVTLVSGRYEAPVGAAQATFGYVGEYGRKPVTKIGFRKVQMAGKELAGIITMPNSLIRRTDPGVLPIIERNMHTSIGISTDIYAMRSDGTPPAIKGLRQFALDESATVTAPTTTDLSVTIDFLSEMESAMDNHNVSSDNAVWFMSTRLRSLLSRMTNGIGNLAFPELLGENPTLNNKPVLHTNTIPSDLGATGDRTELMLANPAHIWFGVEESVQVAYATQGSITAADGTETNLFQQNATAIRLETAHDLMVDHKAAVILAENVLTKLT